MQLSTQPTEYILLTAKTNSEWDGCDFALIPISEDWKNELQKRLNWVEPFIEDPLFISMTYYDTGVEFYKNDNDLVPDSLESLKDKTWSFIITDEKEIEALPTPENCLDCHELVINADGTAYYSASGKYTGEKFWTSHFSIQRLIMALNTENIEP